jgi:hypothetical protein
VCVGVRIIRAAIEAAVFAVSITNVSEIDVGVDDICHLVADGGFSLDIGEMVYPLVDAGRCFFD